MPQRETGMTPYEIMLSRIAGAHAAGGRKGPRGRSLPRLPQVGTGCGRRSASSPATASCACGITARSSPRFPTANWPMKRRSTTVRTPQPLRRAPLEAPDVPQRRSAGRLCRAAGLRRHLLQALDLGAVRLHGPHQHRRRARRRSRHRPHQGDRHVGRDVARWQRPLLLPLAARRREAGGRRVLPQSVDRGRACRWPPPTT